MFSLKRAQNNNPAWCASSQHHHHLLFRVLFNHNVSGVDLHWCIPFTHGHRFRRRIAPHRCVSLGFTGARCCCCCCCGFWWVGTDRYRREGFASPVLYILRAVFFTASTFFLAFPTYSICVWWPCLAVTELLLFFRRKITIHDEKISKKRKRRNNIGCLQYNIDTPKVLRTYLVLIMFWDELMVSYMQIA